MIPHRPFRPKLVAALASAAAAIAVAMPPPGLAAAGEARKPAAGGAAAKPAGASAGKSASKGAAPRATRPASARTPKAAKKATPSAPALATATPEQMEAAQRVYYGIYDCEFKQSVDVSASAKHPHYVEVKVSPRTEYLTKPVLSSTGAVRLEDVKGSLLMVQIASKSMLLNVKTGQRLVDDCVSPTQRELMQAAKRQTEAGDAGLAQPPAEAGASAPAGASPLPAAGTSPVPATGASPVPGAPSAPAAGPLPAPGGASMPSALPAAPPVGGAPSSPASSPAAAPAVAPSMPGGR